MLQVTWNRCRACLLDLLVPLSSLSNLTSLGVRNSPLDERALMVNIVTLGHPQLYTTALGNLRHCCFVVTRNPYTASNNKILFSLYGQYLAMNLDCNGTRQVVQVSCSFAAFGGS